MVESLATEATAAHTRLWPRSATLCRRWSYMKCRRSDTSASRLIAGLCGLLPWLRWSAGEHNDAIIIVGGAGRRCVLGAHG
jgi:hypothetical protein